VNDKDAPKGAFAEAADEAIMQTEITGMAPIEQAEIEQFLKLALPLDGAAPGWIALSSALPLERPADDFRTGYFVRHDFAGMVAYAVAQQALGRHVWISTGTMGAHGKRDRASCIETWQVHADVDRVVSGADRVELTAVGFMLVESGTPGRLHVRARLAAPIDPATALRLGLQLTAWLGGDTGKAGPESLLRLPGLRNVKPGAGMVRLVEEGRVWSVADVSAYLTGRAPAAVIPITRASSAPRTWGGGEIGGAPAVTQTATQARISIEAALSSVWSRSSAMGGFRGALIKASYVLGGYVGAGYDRAAAESGLRAAVMTVWGSVDGEDERWIQQGLNDGAARPFSVVADDPKAEASPALAVGVEGHDAADVMLAEMLDDDGLDALPELDPVVDGYLWLDTLARIIGPSGHGKSFYAVDVALHVATGRPWHGRDVAQGPVVYVVAEGGRGVRKRVQAWKKHHGVSGASGVRYMPRPIESTSLEWLVLIEACRRLRPVLVVIDTQARVTTELDENSPEMGKFVKRVDELRTATGACVAMVHHQGLNGDHGRGHTVVKGALQTELEITKNGDVITLASKKQKDDEELADMKFTLTSVDLGMDAKGRPVNSAVLVAAGGGSAEFGPAEDIGDIKALNDLVGVFRQTFSGHTGGTKADVKSVTVPRVMSRATFYRVWNELCDRKVIGRVRGASPPSFKLIPVDDRKAMTDRVEGDKHALFAPEIVSSQDTVSSGPTT